MPPPTGPSPEPGTGIGIGNTDSTPPSPPLPPRQAGTGNTQSIPSRRRRVDSDTQRPGAVSPFSSTAHRSPKRLKSAEYTPQATSTSPSAFAPAAAAAAAQPNGASMSLKQQSLPMDTPSPNLPSLGRPTARKLVIKNRRPANADFNTEVDRYFESTWAELDTAVDAILDNKQVKISLDRLYRGVEDLCRNGKAERVYTRLVDKVERRAMVVEGRRLRNGGSGEDEDVSTLRCARELWRKWNNKSKLIRSTFSYLDRTYLLKNKKLPQLNDMLIQHFKKMMFNPEEDGRTRGEMAISGMCKIIEQDRLGQDDFDAELLRESITMLHVLSVYVRRFEPYFIRKSSEYFKEFGSRRSMYGLKEYITECRTLLDKETHRCSAFNLDSSTKRQLISCLHQFLVKDYLEKLLDNESLFKLMDDEEVATLHSLYHLLSLSGMHKKFLTPWGLYIRRTGANIIKDTERGDEMVPRLLLLRRSLDTIIRDSLNEDEDFQRALRDGFGDFMNDRKNAEVWDSGTSKIGEMIAKYIDSLLRGGLKALPKSLQSSAGDLQRAQFSGQVSTADEDAELDRQLDQAVELFRHIEGKDAFEAFYKRGLARRLLLDRSASQDAERNMLAKLRGQCGRHFTHNLEQMFKDKDLAKDEMENYHQYMETTGRRAPFDLQVMILSAAAWPSYPDVRMIMPPNISSEIEKFDNFYRQKHTGRVLTWKHALAHCVVKAHFPKGNKELAVSSYQAVILLLFNDPPKNEEGKETLSYDQISKGTGLAGQELDRALQSLACGKIGTRVLTKHPKGKDVKSTDTFSVNLSFSDPKYKVKINQIQLKESKEENKATHEKVAKDRRLETQAAIVRIMKSRKTLGHAVLVAEVIQLTRKRGSVDAAEIKQEIESLIEKDYLERDGTSYVYLA